MKAWTGIGNLIGSNMAILAPACLVLGVLFPDAFSWITPHVTVMFAFITSTGFCLKKLGLALLAASMM